MKKVYVIQMDTKTIPSKLIRLFTMYKYSHIAISFDKECDITYSFGRRNIYSILSGGFVMENKDGKFFKRFNDTRCRIFEIEIDDNKYNSLIKIIQNMENNKDVYGYDYLGIILRYLKIPIKFKNKYVCSYFVAELLQDNDVCDFGKKSCFVSPKDFETIDGFNLIYTGKYALYR